MLTRIGGSMDNQQDNRVLSEKSGYDTPGSDTTVKSTSPAVPTPSKPSQQRLQGPKPVIESIGETPGDANPALHETVSAEEGQATTADVLRARETAEEQPHRTVQGDMYQEQGVRQVPGDLGESEGDQRPNFPYERRGEYSAEYLDPPHADSSLMAGGDQTMGNLKGRADRTADIASEQAASNITKSGLPPVGAGSAEADKYQ